MNSLWGIAGRGGDRLSLLLFILSLVGLTGVARAEDPTRVILGEVINKSTDRHETLTIGAANALATELGKSKLYELVSPREIDRAANLRGLRPPYNVDNFVALMKSLDANLLVTGEIHHVEAHTRGKEREIEVGLIVRVRDLALGEMINGAAERGIATVPADGGRTDIELALDALAQAAARAVSRLTDNKPITGTILNSIGNGPIMLNRGAGHGVKAKQEFLVYRDGVRTGRVKAGKISGAYSELAVLENIGIQPQDRVVSLFPEPKFGK